MTDLTEKIITIVLLITFIIYMKVIIDIQTEKFNQNNQVNQVIKFSII